MLKRVILTVLSLCLIFSICAGAENTTSSNGENTGEVSGQMPQNTNEFPGRDSGNKAMPPSMPDGATPPEGMNRGQMPPGNFSPVQNEEGADASQDDAVVQENNNDGEEAASQKGDPSMGNGNRRFGGQMPGDMGGFPGDMQNFNGQTEEEVKTGFSGFIETYSTPITSVILLALAFVFVIFYRRKNY